MFFVKMTAVILKGREQVVKGVELNPSCTTLTSLTAMEASYDKEGLCIDACSMWTIPNVKLQQEDLSDLYTARERFISELNKQQISCFLNMN